MSTHAKLSPSARHRWGVCPASVRASAQYPEGKSGPSAIDGTHSHTLLEYCLKNTVDPMTTIGSMFSDHEGQFGVERDRANRVKVAYDYIRSRIEQRPDTQMFNEVTVDPSTLVLRNDMSGTVDVLLLSHDLMEIIDYKDGMMPVEVVGNPQLEQYAVGALAKLLKDKYTPLPKNVMFTIVQPKAALKGAPSVSHHMMPTADVIGVVSAKLMNEGAATDAPDAPFVPGEKQCGYCPHRGNCSAATNHALGKAGIKFDDKTGGADKDIVRKAVEAEPSTMNDNDLRELIEAAPLLRKMIEAAEVEAMRRFQSGHAVPGLKVIRGTGRREWVKSEEETANTLVRMGVPKGMVWKTTLISPAGTDNLQWTKTKRDGTVETKELSERQRKVLNGELIRKSDGKLTVVSEADKRTAVDFGDIGAMFAPVPSQEPVPAPAATTESVPDWLNS